MQGRLANSFCRKSCFRRPFRLLASASQKRQRYMPELSPFHVGEQQIQEKVGVREDVEHMGRSMIRSYMPDQHRQFFENQILFYVGTVDESGAPWASSLFGQPGFIKSPDSQTLTIDTKNVVKGDPIYLKDGGFMGCLGLELHSRRRNRVNGHLSLIENGVSLSVDQSFGNCPKYIQVRKIVLDLQNQLESPNVTTGQQNLDQSAQQMIKRSDTFLIASFMSSSPTGNIKRSATGVDVSHRGGPTGFVKIIDSSTLVFPDYTGNFMFQTLGNILENPKCGLLFFDFENGHTLQLTGESKIQFDDQTLPGAQRSIQFKIQKYVYIENALPIKVDGKVEFSPFNPQFSEQQQNLECVSVRTEAKGIKTFEFKMPLDSGANLLEYLPGQFATFDFEIDGKPYNRTWTVSSHPSYSQKTNTFTITIKSIGVVSNWMHQNVQIGTKILFKGFDGDFIPKKCKECPYEYPSVLMVAGGIGVTPIRSMLYEFKSKNSDVTIVYSIRNLKEGPFLKEFQEIAEKSDGKIKLVVTMTGEEEEWQGLRGRVDGEFLEQHVPNVCDKEVYLCGPTGFMNSVTAAFERTGCGLEKVYQESFNF